VQGALSPLRDWKDNDLTDPSRQPWFEKIPFLLGAACFIGQPKERKNGVFEAAAHGTEGI
jgi:hypothetical protein